MVSAKVMSWKNVRLSGLSCHIIQRESQDLHITHADARDAESLKDRVGEGLDKFGESDDCVVRSKAMDSTS
jgi:hypothetical protein